jgi:hypothetical protein
VILDKLVKYQLPHLQHRDDNNLLAIKVGVKHEIIVAGVPVTYNTA